MTEDPGKASAETCARCGGCGPVCPIFRVTGREHLAPRGRLHLLERLGTAADTPTGAAILSQCLLCGACAARCPRGLAPHETFIGARAAFTAYHGGGRLLRQLLARRTLLAPLGRAARGIGRLLPADSGLWLRLGVDAPRLDRARILPVASRQEPAVAYFPGCFAAHLETAIRDATLALAARIGRPATIPAGQGCCGLAAYAAGDLEQARALARRNIRAFGDDDRPIVVSCASCVSHLRQYPSLLADDPPWAARARRFAGRLREFFTFFHDAGLAEALAGAGEAPGPLCYYHDPCHLRHHLGITDVPRLLLQGCGPVTPASGKEARCCGQGGLFHLAHPDLAARMRQDLLAAVTTSGAGQVVTSCTGCLLHLRAGLGDALLVRHPAVLLAGRFGTAP